MDRSSLAGTLRSLAAQTHPGLDIILVNAKGGEHSNVEAHCAPHRLRFINQGGRPLSRSQAGNAGLAAVRGDFLAFLDDDDSVAPDHYARLLAASDGQGIPYAGIQLIDSENPEQPLGEFTEAYEDGRLLLGNFIPIHAPLVPAHLLQHGIRFDDTLPLYEDWDFWLQLNRHARFYYTGHITGIYNTCGTSGVNPARVQEDAKRDATLALYARWQGRLTPGDMWQIADLYHRRMQDLHYLSQREAQLAQQLAAQTARQQQDEAQLASVRQELASCQHELQQTQAAHQASQQQFAEVSARLHAVLNSSSWAITAPLRSLVLAQRKLWQAGRNRQQQAVLQVHYVRRVLRNNGGLFGSLRKVRRILQHEGWSGLLRRLPRTVATAADLTQYPGCASELIAGVSHDPAPGSLAVMVHAYYPEIFPQIAQALAQLPWPYSLYVSVTRPEAQQSVLAAARELPRLDKLDVRIVANRGRDIAPFLVEFREELRGHDYVLHLHTKKSMYTGSERDEWRSHLIDGLLGSEQRIRHIFQCFIRNKDVGIIYPDTFHDLPYWAHTWLSNRHLAGGLAARLGIDIGHCSYFDAPMGSMFWARTDALAPLFALALQLDDFPEERGQTDGTLQHTIERFFVLAARHAGYTHRVMLAADNAGGPATLFFSPGRKNLSQYFVAPVQQRIETAASQADIVSFDIFDTLLLRPWLHPDNLFAFLDDIVAEQYHLPGFAQWRKQAENILRQQQSQHDVHIADIYRTLGEITGRPELAAPLRALEEDYEQRTLFARPDVRAALHTILARGQRIVLASDMYLDHDYLIKLLQAQGIEGFSSLYLSNRIGKRKDRGDLWPEMLQREGVAASRWLHVGDNEHADVQIPLDAGFAHPAHLMRNSDLFNLFNTDVLPTLTTACWQEGLHLGLLANRCFTPGLAVSPIHVDSLSRSIHIDDLEDFGYLCFGPALTAFMAWLLKEARQDNIALLLYASREGHLLTQAHARIARHLAAPASAYFLCSRRAAIFSSITDAGSLDALLNAHFTGTFADFLTLRLGIDDLAPYQAHLGAQRLATDCTLPANKTTCRTLLAACNELLAGAARVEREAYAAYAHTIIGEQRAALVDVGYSATIQKALQRFIEPLAGGYYFATIKAAAEAQADGRFVRGCFAHLIDPLGPTPAIYRYSLLPEAILTAPHGQFHHFSLQDGVAQPHFKAPGQAQEHFADIEKIHRGALRYLDDVLAVTGHHFLRLAGYNQAANLAIQQAITRRWQLASDSPALHVEDNYSGNGELPIFEFYERQH